MQRGILGPSQAGGGDVGPNHPAPSRRNEIDIDDLDGVTLCECPSWLGSMINEEKYAIKSKRKNLGRDKVFCSNLARHCHW